MTLAVTRPLHDVLETQECSAWFANVGSRTVVQQDCWHCFHLLPTCKLLAGLSIRSHWPMLTYASNLPERKGSVGVQCDGMQWMHWMQVQHGAAVLFSFFFWSGVFALWYFTHVLLQLSVLTCHCKPSWKTWYFADMFKEFTVHLAKLWFILVVPRYLFCCLLSWSPWHCRILSCLALHCSALPCVRIYSNHII